MNKSVVIGGIISLIIVIIIVSMVNPMNLTNEKDSDDISDKIIPLEELEIPEKTGRNLSVELNESIGLTSP